MALIRKFHRAIPRLMAYGSEFNQAWTSLISNAIEAVHGCGKISMGVFQEGNQPVVEIMDDGPGLPLEVEMHLFESCYILMNPLELEVVLPPAHAHRMHSLGDISGRQAAIRRAVTPLPGSRARNQFKPLNIPGDCDGLPLLTALGRMVPSITAAEWRAEFAQGRIVSWEHTKLPDTLMVRAGQRYRHLFPNVIEPDVNGSVEILYEDEALIVVNKPAPLPMHAGGRFYLNTLQHILSVAYHPQTPHPAHRLDANTTGLVLVARTRPLATHLQAQFAQGRVEKSYLARVVGRLPAAEFHCDAAISASPGKRCSRTVDLESGQAARTEFRVLRRFPDGTSLLEAQPLTGRTNQIRVHLWHLGFPVCGDALYLPGRQLGHTQTLAVGDPPLCLHAARAKFLHPQSQEPVQFDAPAPGWAGKDQLIF